MAKSSTTVELRELHRRGPIGKRNLARLWDSYINEEVARVKHESEFGSALKVALDLAKDFAVSRWNCDVENLHRREKAM